MSLPSPRRAGRAAFLVTLGVALAGPAVSDRAQAADVVVVAHVAAEIGVTVDTDGSLAGATGTDRASVSTRRSGDLLIVTIVAQPD